MTQRRPRKSRSGFALLIVVLVVALVGVAAVALLDIVNVDLLIVGQHRRTADAVALAYGAMNEVNSDQRVDGTVRPLPNSPSPTYVYARKNGLGNYQRDPNGVVATTPMTDTNSAYVKNLGTSLEQGYEATINLLRYQPVNGTGLNRVYAATHETVVVGSINNGEATREVRAITTQPFSRSNGYIPPRIHAR